MRTTFAWLTLASLTIATAISVASCQQAPATSSGAPAPPAPAGPLWNEPQFTTMLQTYRQKLPGKRRAVRFKMNLSTASLEVQDPAKLVNVDSYDYKGGELSGPSPVDLLGVFQDPNIDDNLFDWDQVAVERIPALVKVALTQTKLEGAKVVEVKITRKALSSAEIAQRIEMKVNAKSRAMERKLRRPEENPPVSGEPKDGENAEHPGALLAPTAVEIRVELQAPGGFGWLTADASGTITGSGVDLSVKGPPVDVNRKIVPRPYWRRR
ncbi:MAG TPA: hypothetical protein VLV54_18625 [Thermoanaerobaculia bacterium]|nr:hypothetical protein [Thermoanaerobaculia bacterium]